MNIRLVRPNRIALTIALLLLAASAGGLGCAFGEIRPDDPFDRLYELQTRQKRYSDFVRWSKFDDAAAFVHSDERSSFVAGMPDFDDVRFTDWKADPWELDEEKRTASIVVNYKGYSTRTLYEVDIVERQEWTRAGSGNDWRVRSSFENLDRVAAH